MFATGLVGEVKRLKEAGLAMNRTASQALGYRQVLAFLEGRISLVDTVEEVKRKTRQYAKRQMTWFRHQPLVQWLVARPGDSPDELAAHLQAQYAHWSTRQQGCG